MLLPPLFPLFIRDFGLSYSELGLLVSTFFVVSGIGQALAGFLVDRVGARPVLFAALSSYAIAYRYYSRFIAYRVLGVDDTRATPGAGPFQGARHVS